MPSRIIIPRDTRTSVYFVDESGSKGSGGDFFVVAALKTAEPDYLTRGMESIRARHGVRRELKFRELTKNSLPIFKELIELVYASGSNLGAFVIDKSTFDPFNGRALWEAHAWAVAALVKGMTTRRELATLLLDGISTPADVAYGQRIRATINDSLRSTRIVSAVSLDSRTCDGLQLADLVASAVAHQRVGAKNSSAEAYLQNGSPKAEISRYLARTFGLADFSDVRTDRVNVRTAQPGHLGRRPTGVEPKGAA